MRVQRTTKVITLVAIAIIAIAISVYTSGLLQNNNFLSNGNSQNNGFATYTGYLANAYSYLAFSYANGSYPNGIGNGVSMTFADGRTFLANETLAVNAHVVLNATYTVYYNVTQPNVAIEIVKK